MSLMNDIKTGELIKQLRLEKNLSQEALAESAGVSRSNLNRLENGKGEASIETLLKLNKVLGGGLIGSHMAHYSNSKKDTNIMLSEYVEESTSELSKKDFNIFYGLIEHVAENYCDGDIDPKVTLINSHVNYDDIRDLLIDVVKSRLNYYTKKDNK
jgi:transcriptional regulator with XRE-family HTH domain